MYSPINPPPISSMELFFFSDLPKIRSTSFIDSLSVMIYILSPLLRTSSPPGISVNCLRLMASTLIAGSVNVLPSSLNGILRIGVLSSNAIPINWILPSAKSTISVALDCLISLTIRFAACFSGWMMKSQPSSSGVNTKSFDLNSGFLTRATVVFAPIVLAIRQAIRFTSSLFVNAAKISAFSVRASFSDLWLDPNPSTIFASKFTLAFFTFSQSDSIIVILCLSKLRRLARWKPISPAPTITISIILEYSLLKTTQ